MEHMETNPTFYEQLMDCRTDKELERLIKVEKREQFFTRVAGEEIGASTLLKRCKDLIMFGFLAY